MFDVNTRIMLMVKACFIIALALKKKKSCQLRVWKPNLPFDAPLESVKLQSLNNIIKSSKRKVKVPNKNI